MFFRVWTDGSCDYKTKLGGWAYIIEDRLGNVRSSHGGLINTTNQRAEITAALEAILSIEQDSEIILISDSEYLLKGISLWMETWSRTGWRIKNPDLWKKLYGNIKRKNIIVHCEWIRGHSGNEYNEECDRLASLARKEASRRSVNS